MGTDGTRRWGRVLKRVGLGVGVFALALVCFVVFLGPALAGRLARGAIEREASAAIEGTVDVQRVRLSWFGSQTIGPAVLRDPDGGDVAELSIKTSAGLLGLIFGSLDLGAVTISGRVDLVESADGVTNLQRAVALGAESSSHAASPSRPGAAASPHSTPRREQTTEPMKLPRSLAGVIQIDALDVSYLREAHDPADALRLEVRGLKGGAKLTAGEPVTMNLKASAEFASGAEQRLSPGGSLSLDVTVRHVLAVDGTVTLDRAEVEAIIEVSDASVELADLFAGQEGRLAAALGGRARATLRAWGGASEFFADFSASSPSASADAGLRYADGWLSTSRPLTIRALTEGAAEVSPALREALNHQGVFILDVYPNVTLQIDARVQARDGAPLDLRGSKINASLRLGELSARVWMAGESGPPTAYRVEPWELRLEAPDLGGSIRLYGGTRASMDRALAGSLDIDLTLHGLLDESGGLRATGPDGVDGTFVLAGLKTAPIESVLIPFGVDLAQDIGPELNAKLTASQRRPSPGEAPRSLIEASIEAANIRALAEGEMADGVVRTVGRGVEARIARAGPLLNRMLLEHGVTVASATTVSMTLRNLTIAWDAVTNPQGLDLRGIAGNFAMHITETRGHVRLADDAAATPWRITPTQIRASSPGQGRDITVTATTSATLADQPAGKVEVSLVVKQGLDATGAMQDFKPESIVATVRVSDIAAAALGAFVPTRDSLDDALGPEVDLELTATVRPRQIGTTGGLPRIDGELAIGASLATASGAFRLSQNTFTIPDGLSLTAQDAGRLLAALVGDAMPAEFDPGGQVGVTISDVSIPFTPANAPDLASASARLAMTLTGVTARTSTEPPRALTLTTLTAALAIADGAPPSLTLSADGRKAEKPVTVSADLKAPGLLRVDPETGLGLDLLDAKLVGRLRLDAPSAVADFIFPSNGDDPMMAQLAALVRNLFGERIELDATFAETTPGFGATGRIAAEQVSVDLAADVSRSRIDLRALSASTTLTTAAFESLLAIFAPELEPRPRLAQPGPVTLTVSPLTIPRGDTGSLELGRVSEVAFALKAPQRFVVQGLRFMPADGPARPIGPVGVQALDASIKAPLAALLGQDAGQVALTLSMTMLDEGGQAGQVSARAAIPLVGGKPSGRAMGEFTATDMRLRVADRFLADPGLISGAVGETTSTNATFDLVFDPSAGEGASPISSGTFTARITSPRIQIAQPLRVELKPDSMSIAALRGTWKLSPDWANRWIVAQPGKPQPLQLDREVDIQFNLAALTLSRGEGVGPLKPGVFRLQFAAAAKTVALALPGGEVVTLSDLSFNTGHTVQGSGAGLNLTLHDEAVRGPDPIAIQAVAYALADEAGVFTPDLVTITGSAKAAALSTPLIDAILGQQGLLTELLGPRVMVDVQARGASMSSGRIVATAESARAKAVLSGDVNIDGLLTVQQSEVTIKEITPTLGSTLFTAMPLIGAVEKRATDTPHTTLTLTGLTYPLDGDMSRLNASIRLEPGPLRFTTSALFGGVLKAVHQRDFASASSLRPLTMTVTDGTLSYERYSIPIGEFTFQTQGTVNLADRTLNVVTYVPLGALTDEAVGSFRTGVGTILGQIPVFNDLTMVPIRATGSLDKTSVNIDAATFVREFGRQLLRPDQLLERGVRQILERIGG